MVPARPRSHWGAGKGADLLQSSALERAQVLPSRTCWKSALQGAKESCSWDGVSPGALFMCTSLTQNTEKV